MLLSILFATLASLCFTIGPIFASRPLEQISAYQFGKVRITISFIVCLTLLPFSIFFWEVNISEISWISILYLSLSGVLGIAVGEMSLHYSVQYIGTRIANVIYAFNAPLTAIIAFIVLFEPLSITQQLGIFLASAGVITVLLFCQSSDREIGIFFFRSKRNILIGIAFGLIAALMQAVGIIAAKPVMTNEFNPILAAGIRTGSAAVILYLYSAIRGHLSDYKLERRYFYDTAISALVSTGAGMTLILLALASAPTGIVSIFSSLAPIFMLPVLYFWKKQRISGMSVIGTIIAVLGIWFIFVDLKIPV